MLCRRQTGQAVIAKIPKLPGCAADGATYQEALANVEVVIGEWIETTGFELIVEQLGILRSRKARGHHSLSSVAVNI
jgi:predicted RNase H-like HicB family nuclease